MPTPIAGEHPLTLYVDKCEVVTLMTLGEAPEALAIGYLRNQRLVVARRNRRRAGRLGNRRCRRHHATRPRGLGEARKRTVTTGCGQGTVFGDLMEEIESPPARGRALPEATLFALLEAVRRTKRSTSRRARCTAARSRRTSPTAEILIFVEDVGRHNAVDAIAGRMWLDGIDGSDKIFYTTGRLTSEMVIKAAQMGIPFLVSRSGLTQMGYEIADKVGITMIGRATGKHFLLFTGGSGSGARAMNAGARVTGVVLAGGQGRRMGGVDKGLRARRPADDSACARAPRAAGRRRADQRQPEPRALSRVRLIPSCRTTSAVSPGRSPGCTPA